MSITQHALTVKQPWAWAIIHGGKDVENRSRPTKHRGLLYIHAGKGWADKGIDAIGIDAMPADDAFLAGMVVGTVNVLDCHHPDDCPGPEYTENGMCSVWAEPNQYHWVLDDPRPLEIPFKATGRLGLWNIRSAP